MLVRVIAPLFLLGILLLFSIGSCSQTPVVANQSELQSVIFTAEEVPWETMENGWRRKVLFSGQLTFVVLEAKGPTTGSVELHSHVHDQISYVMEGQIEAHIGDEIKQISTGGFYRVPSNAPHGVQVLSEKLLLIDAFTPPREDFRK